MNYHSRTYSQSQAAPIGFQGFCIDVAVNKESAMVLRESFIDPEKHAAQALIVKISLLWDNGATVTFAFLDRCPGTVAQQEKVKLVIKEWEKYANIRFRHARSGSNADIRITFDPNVGSWSCVGTECTLVPQDLPTMNLAHISTDSSITCSDEGIILHEFGHALGFIHEYRSHVEGGSTILHDQAIIARYLASQTGWTEDTVRSQILDVYNNGNVTNFFQVDPTSIMKYPLTPDMILQGTSLPPNAGLSELDKAFLFIYYPLPPGANPVWTMQHALEIVGVEGEYKDYIIEAYRTRNLANVRFFFSVHWNVSRLISKQRRDLDTHRGPVMPRMAAFSD